MRGRTKGATSNVLISLQTLNEVFHPNALIPVARRFANENSLIGSPVYVRKETIEAAGNQVIVEEKIAIEEIKE